MKDELFDGKPNATDPINSREQSSLDFVEDVKDIGNRFINKLIENETRLRRKSGWSEKQIADWMDEVGVYQVMTEEGDDMYWFGIYYATTQVVLEGGRLQIPEEQRVVQIELCPGIGSIDNGRDYIPNATNNLGRLPMAFFDKKGRRFEVHNEFVLSPFTGEAYKLEDVCEYEKTQRKNSDLIDVDNIPTIDIEVDTDKMEDYRVKRELLPEDMEFLESIIGRIEKNVLTIA